jgi:H+/Cl- antiporter ClcA
MEEFLSHLIHFALWAFFVIFAFAVVGVVATIRWIVRLVTRTEDAVGSGIHSAEDALHRH